MTFEQSDTGHDADGDHNHLDADDDDDGTAADDDAGDDDDNNYVNDDEDIHIVSKRRVRSI